MPSDQFGPVSVAALGSGKTIKQLDAKLQKTAQTLRDWCFENGYDMTKGAKAEVTLKVRFVHLESGIFAVRSVTKESLPEGPAESMHLVVENGKILAPLSEFLEDHDDVRQQTLPLGSDRANPNGKAL